MKRKTLLLLTSLTAGSVLTAIAVTTGANEDPTSLLDSPEMMSGGLLPQIDDQMESATFANPDSVRMARMYEAVDEAAKIYKHLKWQKFEGEDENSIYASAMQCYEAALKALELTEPSTQEHDQCKNMLRDINRDLQSAAFHYSASGDNQRMTSFAQAMVDTRLMDEFKDEKFPADNGAYAPIVYCAASGAYNAKEFARAIKYFNEYLATGETRSREQIYLFLGQACLNTGDYTQAITAMTDAIEAYPTNYSLVLIKLQAAMDGGHPELIQDLLNKAFVFRSGDEQLLMIQGKLYEDQQEYNKALDTYNTLETLRPNNLGIAKRVALCYYNLGVNYYNKVIFEQDEKNQKKYRRQSDAYFDAAALKLEEVLANDPLSMKYLKALAVTYGCIGNMDKFAEINTRIQALGDTPISEKDLPSEVTANDGNASNFASSGTSGKSLGGNAPLYSDFAKSYVEKNLAKWVGKGEFEKVEDYQQRVNDMAVKNEYSRLCKEAEKEYLTLYTKQLRPKDFQLKPYDAGNEIYLIESNFGPIYLPVPLANGEAEIFKANWDRMKVHNPHYYIDNDKVLMAGITFMTPYGKSYTYDNSKALAYAQTAVDVDFNRILADANKGIKPTSTYSAPVKVARVTVKSDVDENIPITNKKAPSTFAVIIANEVYANVPKVESALNDGDAFSRYLNLTLGLPKENIRVYRNAGLAQMHRAVADIKNIVKAVDGKADVIFYYAGHGMPDEATKNAYLLPVDGDALVSETCLSLNKIYTDLASMGANSVMVFLDACFSGSQRSESGMLTAARSVVIKAKDAAPQGNMFSFTATSGQETALPYKEKNHGLFTYFLLKKLQESKGNVTLKELTDYVTENVKRQSTITNGKPQTPTVTTSGSLSSDWTKRKL